VFRILIRHQWCIRGRVDTRITFWNSREKRDSLFRPQILAWFSQDSRVKIWSETCFTRVSLWHFVSRIASYESDRKKFRSKTRFSRVSQENFVVRLASLRNRNFIARLARININFNCGVLQEYCKNFGSNTNFSQWIMILLVCESCKLRDSQASQYIAVFPSRETRQTLETRTDIFVRSESHFPQSSREKNCETRLAVNPTPKGLISPQQCPRQCWCWIRGRGDNAGAVTDNTAVMASAVSGALLMKSIRVGQS
jgi:hypothetical protein